jgi:hypothetical protein
MICQYLVISENKAKVECPLIYKCPKRTDQHQISMKCWSIPEDTLTRRERFVLEALTNEWQTSLEISKKLPVKMHYHYITSVVNRIINKGYMILKERDSRECNKKFDQRYKLEKEKGGL